MAIALHSAGLAARMFLAGQGAPAYHRRLREDVAGPVRRATAIYRFGRWGAGQAGIVAAAGMFPYGLRVVAALTRVTQGQGSALDPT
jgi:hypothetical protein